MCLLLGLELQTSEVGSARQVRLPVRTHAGRCSLSPGPGFFSAPEKRAVIKIDRPRPSPGKYPSLRFQQQRPGSLGRCRGGPPSSVTRVGLTLRPAQAGAPAKSKGSRTTAWPLVIKAASGGYDVVAVKGFEIRYEPAVSRPKRRYAQNSVRAALNSRSICGLLATRIAN